MSAHDQAVEAAKAEFSRIWKTEKHPSGRPVADVSGAIAVYIRRMRAAGFEMVPSADACAAEAAMLGEEMWPSAPTPRTPPSSTNALILTARPADQLAAKPEEAPASEGEGVMAWREALLAALRFAPMTMTSYTPSVETEDRYHERLAYSLANTLLSRSPADRIALARELLAGTGWVPARAVARRKLPGAMRTESALDYAQGWNAARAAMLGEKR